MEVIEILIKGRGEESEGKIIIEIKKERFWRERVWLILLGCWRGWWGKVWEKIILFEVKVGGSEVMVLKVNCEDLRSERGVRIWT